MKLFAYLFLAFSLFGQIQEISSFKEIETYVTDDSLLILDIDDTLITPVQMLGGDA